MVAGQRVFTAGLVALVLFACGHFGGYLHASYAARHDPGLADMTRAMREHKSRLLGFSPSLLDFREYFSLNFSILLLLATALGMAALSVATDKVAAVRVLSLVYVVAMLVLLGSSLLFSVGQGVVSCTCIALLFILSWWRASFR